ncbi:MAG: amidohydrolase family protein [Planctomycetota bacterium]
MIVDVHCHVGFSAKRVDRSIPRFSFEETGARGTPGYDSYLSPRLFHRVAWRFVRRWLGVPSGLGRGDELDAHIRTANRRQWSALPSVDRLVLLAFDEYHDDEGRPVGEGVRRRQVGSDLYVSNTVVRAMCSAQPDRFLFGASLHPYREQSGRNACDMLAEVAAAGAVLVKWLPIHQNIRADDERTVAFLRRAAELGIAMLIHYGGEMSLARQHREFERPEPMLEVLRTLRGEDAMPTVIVAHAATPSFRFQSAAGHRALLDAMLGEFADAPLYADISALLAPGRTSRLADLARRPELHGKLVWGSDYPIPVFSLPLWRMIDRKTRRRIAAQPSWIERSIRLCRAAGFGETVFTQAAEILRVKTAPQG